MSEPTVALHDLIVEIHALDRRLHTLEEKYNLLSADFYKLYQEGRLQDEEIEDIDEFGRWAAWHRMRTHRLAQYDTLKNAFLTENGYAKEIVLKPHALLREAA